MPRIVEMVRLSGASARPLSSCLVRTSLVLLALAVASCCGKNKLVEQTRS